MTSAGAAAHGRPVAIVGIGCRFPGSIVDPASFWRVVSEGVDAITEIPRDRLDVERFYDPRPATPGRMMSRFGGYLDHIEDFDPGFFGISPREAQSIDPQQRVLLETAWEALEDAGQDVLALEGSRTAVFVGQWLSDFESRLFTDPEVVDFAMTTGSGRYASSGRISYVFGLRGPSLTLDSGCSSSLAAVHLGVRSIRSGEADLALAGGVNVILQPHITIGYSQSRMMAADGHCRFGDASGEGYVRSEGAGLVVLKALDRAVADGDRIYAVVRGTSVNNDGRSSGSFGTPSRIGQEEMVRAAYDDAAIAPARVGYVEAHGPGTRAGDPVELAALGAVLGAGRPAGASCLVGSVKTNIGHTESAAGVAGLIKAALALHHGAVPASLNFKQPNPQVPWADLPLKIPTVLTPWPGGAVPRVAGVNSFGIAGTNSHAVLEEAPASVAVAAAKPSRQAALLPLSARSPEALRALAALHAAQLEDTSPASSSRLTLHDLCWTAATRRTALEHRAAVVAEDRAAMVKALRLFAGGEPAAAEGVALRERRKLVFVVPGQGAQWVGMGRELAEREPIFRAALERCDAAARRWGDFGLLEQLRLEPGAPRYRLGDIDVIQPVLVALAIAYADLWRSLGVMPGAVVGHSMGEVGAAHIAGVLDLEQAMQIICRRSALMRRTAGRGAMALVELPMADAQARLRGRADRVAVAGSNSPRSSVISGEPEAIKEVLAELEREAIFCRQVKVDVASHSPQMEPLAAELAAELGGLRPGAAAVPIYSTVLGRPAEGQELDASYWGRNMRQPVLFGATTEQLIEDRAGIFVELGPHPVLLPSIQQTAQAAGAEVAALVCGRRDEPEQATLLAALGGLWAAGHPIDFNKLMPEGGRRVPLPLYPWQRERHWIEAAEMVRGDGGGVRMTQAGTRPDDESLSWLYRWSWESSPAAAGAAGRGAWLALAADEAAGAALAAALTSAGARAESAPLARLEEAVAAWRAADDGSLAGIVVLAPEGADAPFAPIRTLQAILEAPFRSRPRLWLVTRGAQAVVSAPPERVSVDQGALWGAGRVIAEEHPELWGGLADLDPIAPAADQAAPLAGQLLAPGGEEQVAFRGGQRHVLRLSRVEPDSTPSAFAFRADAAYLVTGGLGDIGLHVARAMVQRGARRVVLLGRTPLPPRDQWSTAAPDSTAGRRIAAIRALESLGAAVHVASVDVGDEERVRAFLDQYRAEAWPPIRGVVHAAATLDNQLAATMARAPFESTLRAKLRGAEILDRLLPDLDLFVTFSSIVATLGLTGAANYAAANAGLDALAHDRQARGRPAVSIAWGVWANTGLVSGEEGGRVAAEYGRQGIKGFSADRAIKIFAWLCGRGGPPVAVMDVDWAAFRNARPGRGEALYRHLLTGATAAGDESELRARLAGAGQAERRPLLEAAVREAAAKVLKIAPARLDPRKALGSLGLTSIMAMELRNRLEAALGRSLSATLAWNYPTVVAMTEHLLSDAPRPASAARPEASLEASIPVGDLGAIAGLSDEEAALALRGSRPRRAR
jgi:acyl transferase domain-containing protein